MFSSLTFSTLVVAIIALCHRYKGQYPEKRDAHNERLRRRAARYDKKKAEARKATAKYREKRRKQRREERVEAERVEGIRSRERRSFYGRAY